MDLETSSGNLLMTAMYHLPSTCKRPHFTTEVQRLSLGYQASQLRQGFQEES